MNKHVHAGGTRKIFDDPIALLRAAGLTQGGTLLDIGTGSGYLAIAAADIMGPAGKVYALDSHAASVEALQKEIAARALTTITALTADANHPLPIPRGTVTVCLMSNVLHGFAANNETERVMKNINAALAEVAMLIVIDFIPQETGFGPPLSIRLSPDAVEDLLRPYGYEPGRRFQPGPHHYGLVFKRVPLQDRYC